MPPPEKYRCRKSLVTASSDALTRVAAYTPRAAEPLPVVPAVRLVIEGAAIESGDMIPVGLKAEGPIDGAVAVVSGLVVGTVLSAGQPWGSTAWVVPADQLAERARAPAAGLRRHHGLHGRAASARRDARRYADHAARMARQHRDAQRARRRPPAAASITRSWRRCSSAVRNCSKPAIWRARACCCAARRKRAIRAPR